MPKRKGAQPRRATSRRPRRKTTPAPGESLRAFAKRVGVSHTAVAKAVRVKRLHRSIERNARGTPRVADIKLALQEWNANRAQVSPAAPPSTTPPAAQPTNGDNGGLGFTLSQAQTRVNLQRETKLELENLRTRGLLIDAARERRSDFECARTVRDSMLNLPDRLHAELAAETDPARVHARLDEEIRKALAALADHLEGMADPAVPPDPAGEPDAA